jgi:hypothetical protein
MAKPSKEELARLEEKKKVRVLNGLLRQAINFRKEHDSEWDRHERVYLQEDSLRQPERHMVKMKKANTKTNLLHAELETIKSILSQSLPTAIFRAVLETPAWNVIAKGYEMQIARIFRRNDMKTRTVDVVSNAQIRAKGYFKIMWDKERLGGLGDIRISVPDTKNIYLEPGKMDIEDMNYVFETCEVSKLTLLRMYPGKADDIERIFKKEGAQKRDTASGSTFENPAEPYSTETSPSAAGASANTTTQDIFDLSEADTESEKPPTIRLVEVWFYDGEMEDKMVEVPDIKVDEKTGERKVTKKKEMRSVPRHPYGSVVKYIGDVILDERANPFPGFPYAEFWNYRVVGQQYGISELKYSVSIQELYDKRKNQLHDLLNFNLAPIRYFGAGSGVDLDKITNTPALMVPCNDVRQIHTEQPPHIPEAAFSSLQMLREEMDNVTGVEAVLRGRSPGDIRSGAGLEALQEQADVRLHTKSHDLETAVRELAAKAVCMITKNYIDGKHWGLASTPVPDMETTVGETAEYKFIKSKTLTPDFFDIEIQAGVNKPRSRVAKQQFMQWLYGSGIADDEYVVDHSDLDGAEELKRRMKPFWDAKWKALLGQYGQAPEGGIPSGGSNPIQSVS